MDALVFAKVHHDALKTRLRAEFSDLDEQTVADTVEGLSNLHDILAEVIRSALADEAMGAGLRQRISQMQERLNRLEERASKCRDLARDVMIECEIKKITAPDFSIAMRPGTPSVVVTDEHAIPEHYFESREPRLNRQLLNSDLKSGRVIAGAVLNNPQPVLSVRVK